jgi:hypothetical protein
MQVEIIPALATPEEMPETAEAEARAWPGWWQRECAQRHKNYGQYVAAQHVSENLGISCSSYARSVIRPYPRQGDPTIKTGFAAGCAGGSQNC